MQHTLLYHLLNGTRWIDLHREKVIKAINFRSIFRKLLTEGIREIVSWIRGLRVVRGVIQCTNRLTISNTDLRHFASWIASEQEVVVLPVEDA